MKSIHRRDRTSCGFARIVAIWRVGTASPSRRERQFESPFLQRRVSRETVFFGMPKPDSGSTRRRRSVYGPVATIILAEPDQQSPFERDLAEFVVRRIAAHCAYVDEPGAFGIRPEPAAAILRRCGMQTRRAPGRRRMRRSARSSGLAWSRQLSRCRRTAQFDRGCVKKLKSQQGRRIVFSIALAPIAATARYSSLD